MNTETIVRNGNSKLGKGIGKVSLPPIVTCPGASVCKKPCYAVKLTQRFKGYREMNQRHLDILTNEPDTYFDLVRHDLTKGGYKVLRLSESGDLFSKEQIKGWIGVAKDFPNVSFYGYTRTWKVPALLPLVQELANQPNVQLLASIDPGDEAPEGFRTATIIPKGAKAEPQAIVCPEQTGKKESCLECGFCIFAPKSKTANVNFWLH